MSERVRLSAAACRCLDNVGLVLAWLLLALALWQLASGQDVKPLLAIGRNLVDKVDAKCKQGVKFGNKHLYAMKDQCANKYLTDDAELKWPSELLTMLDCFTGDPETGYGSKEVCDAADRKKAVQCAMGKLFAKMAFFRKFYKENKKLLDAEINDAKNCALKYIEEMVKPEEEIESN